MGFRPSWDVGKGENRRGLSDDLNPYEFLAKNAGS